MKVCVVGLWHLGTVTAACLASAGHQVIGFDFDHETIPPVLNLRSLNRRATPKGDRRSGEERVGWGPCQARGP